MRSPARVSALSALAMLVPIACSAQSALERQIASAGDSPAQFHFAARAGVCGNGRTYFRSDDDSWYGNINFSDGRATDQCVNGPVRVVVTRAGKDVVRVETFVGPQAPDAPPAKELGAVSTKEAVAYLLNVASTTDGKPARDALTPAMLADSSVVTPKLLEIAKDQSRSRDIRRSAINWLARRRDEPGGVGAAGIAKALDQLVRDRTESETIRQQALGTISRFDRGEGIPTLMGFAGDQDKWLAKQAFQTLARSGDPRARQFVRDQIKRTDLDEETRAEAIRGIGDDYATAADIKMLRDLYPALNSDNTRDAVLSVVANAGGSENTGWLLDIAKSKTEPAGRRRRAVSLLSRYDDARVKEALKGLINP
ncbi:MAG: HEAT repeat domain-containing protein [Gemmatimonadaceae bacterium]